MRDIRFLYWNTGKKNSTQEEVLTHIFNTELPPDVLLLGECLIGLTPDFLQEHGFELMPYNLLPGEKPTQQVYVRLQADLRLTHLTTDGGDEPEELPVPGVSPAYTFLTTNPAFVARAVLLKLEVDNEATLIASIHLASRWGGHQDEASQLGIANHYKSFIAQAGGRPLSEFGQRIAVIGDFNMNPFDLGMVEPMGFYALNSRAVVRHTRSFHHAPALMFYNPCWTLLSDINSVQPTQFRVPGSHYYTGTPSKKLYWHLYDQLVLSESLIDRLEATELRVASYTPLEQEAELGLRPAGYSDHLPLCFTLRLGNS